MARKMNSYKTHGDFWNRKSELLWQRERGEHLALPRESGRMSDVPLIKVRQPGRVRVQSRWAWKPPVQRSASSLATKDSHLSLLLFFKLLGMNKPIPSSFIFRV